MPKLPPIHPDVTGHEESAHTPTTSIKVIEKEEHQPNGTHEVKVDVPKQEKSSSGSFLSLASTRNLATDITMNPTGFYYQERLHKNLRATFLSATPEQVQQENLVDRSMGLNNKGVSELPQLRSRRLHNKTSGSTLGGSGILEEEEELDRIITYDKHDSRAYVDPSDIDPYLYHIAQSHFQLHVFLFEFLVHLFMPVIVLLAIFSRSARLIAINRAFLYYNKNTFAVISQWFYYTAAIVLNVLYMVYFPPNVSYTEVLMADSFVIVRFLIIASKYAFTSPVEYIQISTQIVSRESAARRQVVSGWMSVPPSLRDMQLLLASTRKGVCLKTAHFVLEDGTPNILTEDTTKQNNAQTSSNSATNVIKEKIYSEYNGLIPQETENDLKIRSVTNNPEFMTSITVWDVAVMLLVETAPMKIPQTVLFGATIVHALVPLLAVLTDTATGKTTLSGFATTPTVTMVAFHVINLLEVLFVVGVSWIFLAIGILDFRRRDHIQNRLNAILEDGYILVAPENPLLNEELNVSSDKMNPVKVLQEARVIRIPLEKETNLLAFWYLKECLQDWGLPYYLRIQLYTGIFQLIAFSLVIVLFLFLFILDLQPDTHLVLFTVYEGCIMSFIIGLMIVYGGSHNREKLECSRRLTKRKTEFLDLQISIETDIKVLSQRPRQSASTKRLQDILKWEHTRISNLMRTVGVVQDCVDRDLENKIRILGFEAGPQLIQGIVSVAAVAVSLSLRKFLGF